MTERIKYIVSDLLTDSEVLTKEKIAEITSQFPFTFPELYLNSIALINGKEGGIGPDSWICLFPLEELKEVNKNYHLLMDDIPDYFLIGKDAADTGYAFHKLNGTFHSFGLMSNFETDFIDFMGHNFYEFLENLFNYRFQK